MVSSASIIKFSSPVARSSLVAIGILMMADAILTILAANQYPYLIDYFHAELYVSKSRMVAVVYSSFAIALLLVGCSTVVAAYRNSTNYALINAGITGIFVPASILIYFSTGSSRYKAIEYVDDYKQMIADYRVGHRRRGPVFSLDTGRPPSDDPASLTQEPEVHLSSFVNLIDTIQSKFACCGVESAQDWLRQWSGFVAPTCCLQPLTKSDTQWATLFEVEPEHQFTYCTVESSHQFGCLVAIKESEHTKYIWLANLVVFAIMLALVDAIVSLLLFGLTKTEETSSYEESALGELSMVGVSSKPRPSQPTITSIRPRPSVFVSPASNREIITSRAQVVKFDIANSPFNAANAPGGRKFSAAARRGSSFL